MMIRIATSTATTTTTTTITTPPPPPTTPTALRHCDHLLISSKMECMRAHPSNVNCLGFFHETRCYLCYGLYHSYYTDKQYMFNGSMLQITFKDPVGEVTNICDVMVACFTNQFKYYTPKIKQGVSVTCEIRLGRVQFESYFVTKSTKPITTK